MITTTYLDRQLAFDLTGTGPLPLVLDTFHGPDGTLVEDRPPDIVTAPAVGPWIGTWGWGQLTLQGNEAVNVIGGPHDYTFTQYQIETHTLDLTVSGRFRFASVDAAFNSGLPSGGCVGGVFLFGRCGLDIATGAYELYVVYAVFDGVKVYVDQNFNGIAHDLGNAVCPIADGAIFDASATYSGDTVTVKKDGVIVLTATLAVPSRSQDTLAGVQLSRVLAGCGSTGARAQTHVLQFRAEAP